MASTTIPSERSNPMSIPSNKERNMTLVMPKYEAVCKNPQAPPRCCKCHVCHLDIINSTESNDEGEKLALCPETKTKVVKVSRKN